MLLLQNKTELNLHTSYVYEIDTVIIGSMKTMFIVVASPCLGKIYSFCFGRQYMSNI